MEDEKKAGNYTKTIEKCPDSITSGKMNKTHIRICPTCGDGVYCSLSPNGVLGYEVVWVCKQGHVHNNVTPIPVDKSVKSIELTMSDYNNFRAALDEAKDHNQDKFRVIELEARLEIISKLTGELRGMLYQIERAVNDKDLEALAKYYWLESDKAESAINMIEKLVHEARK